MQLRAEKILAATTAHAQRLAAVRWHRAGVGYALDNVVQHLQIFGHACNGSGAAQSVS
jgi:hypothetical protein